VVRSDALPSHPGHGRESAGHADPGRAVDEDGGATGRDIRGGDDERAQHAGADVAAQQLPRDLLAHDPRQRRGVEEPHGLVAAQNDAVKPRGLAQAETQDIGQLEVRPGILERRGPRGRIAGHRREEGTVDSAHAAARDERDASYGVCSGQVAEDGFITVFWFMAVLSINLGLINIMPVPMLDGGHLLFYAFEAIRGRPLGERAQDYGFRIGIALLLSLMVFATWNDLVHLKVVDFFVGLFS